MRPQIMLTFGISLEANREEVAILKDAIDSAFDERDKKSVQPGPDIQRTPAPDIQRTPAPEQAPTTAPTTQPTVSPNETRDAAGLPWDGRIHSDPPKTNKDGTWRTRRGVDAGTLAKVTAELLATTTATPTPALTLTPPPVAAPAPPPVAAPAPPPAMPAVDPAYTAFVQYLASITQSPDNPNGRVDADWVKGCLSNFGVANGDLQNLLHRIDLIPTIDAAIKAALA